jgi:hypothetical protein
MPSKGSKAAARQRQAQERNRRRKGGVARGRGQEFDPGPEQARTPVGVTEPELLEEESSVRPQTSAVRATSVARTQRPVRSARQRGVSAEPLIYRYIGGELRQIGIITVLMGIILAALTFLLGG